MIKKNAEISYISDRLPDAGGCSIIFRGHVHSTGAKVWVWHKIGCMHFCATRPVKCLALTSSISLSSILLLSLAYSPIQVDITDPQLTMGEQVSLTRFLCCACHARGEGSAFFGTRRAAEVHISRSLSCKNTCKGVQSVPVLYRDSQRQDDHEAGPVGAPGH